MRGKNKSVLGEVLRLLENKKTQPEPAAAKITIRMFKKRIVSDGFIFEYLLRRVSVQIKF